MAILVTAVALSIEGQTAMAVARDAYTKADDEYRSAQDDFAAADADATSTVASTAPESLADPLALSTLTSLQASLSTAKPIALVEIGEMGDVGQIDEHRRAVEVAAGQLRHNTEALTQAVDDVAASVLLKSVSDAEISLDSTISETESVLADSEGRVPDDAGRVESASGAAASRALWDCWEQRSPRVAIGNHWSRRTERCSTFRPQGYLG